MNANEKLKGLEVHTNHAWSKLFWPCAFVLFFVTALPNQTIWSWIAPPLSLSEHIDIQLHFIQFFIQPMRESLFFFALIGITSFIALPIYQARENFKLDRPWVPLKVFLCLCLLLLPGALLRGTMGLSYARFSINPFAMETGHYYRRILLPALCNFLHLHGIAPYMLMSFVLTLVLVYFVALVWKRFADQEPKMIYLLSFCTLSFVAVHFQFPGFTEKWVAILLLLTFVVPFNSHGRLTCLVLALVTHEIAAITMFLPAVLFLYPKRERIKACIAIILFIFLVLANFKFSVSALVRSQTVLSEYTAQDYFWMYPGRLAWGIALAYKALWLALLVGIYQMVKKQQYRLAGFCLTATMLPLMSLYLGVDTSRIAGFGFLAVLFACFSILSVWSSRALFFLFVMNALLPSYYMGLNSSIFPHFGLYAWYFKLFQRLFG